MRGAKSSAYDGGHRVPLFIRWPNGRLGKPRDIATISAHIDLLPTLMDLCRLRRADGPPLDGVSLGPLLRNENRPWPGRTLFTQIHGGPGYRAPEDKWVGSAVMTQRWRLVEGEGLFDIREDPSQSRNLAKQHPEVFQRLRQAHDRWYAGVSEGMKPTRIVVGHDRENPANLTSEDWVMPSGGTVWSRSHVLKRQLMNGPWHLQVHRDGAYRITLSRWPRYIHKPIESTRARLKIGGIDRSMDIDAPSAKTEISFQVELATGPVELRTWLTTPEGETHGAYFVSIERLAE